MGDEFVDATWWALGRRWGYTLGPSALVPAKPTGDAREARVWTFAPLAAGTYTVALARPYDEPAMIASLGPEGVVSDLLEFKPYLALLPAWTVTADADTEAPRWGEVDRIERYDPACYSRGGGPGWIVSARVSEDVWVRMDAGGQTDVSLTSRRDGVARFLVYDTTGSVDLTAVDAAGNESMSLRFKVIPGSYGVGPKLVPR
jgi:hypothetical protein